MRIFFFAMIFGEKGEKGTQRKREKLVQAEIMVLGRFQVAHAIADVPK